MTNPVSPYKTEQELIDNIVSSLKDKDAGLTDEKALEMYHQMKNFVLSVLDQYFKKNK